MISEESNEVCRMTIKGKGEMSDEVIRESFSVSVPQSFESVLCQYDTSQIWL